MDPRLEARLLRLEGATMTISDEHNVMISVPLDVLTAFVAKYTEYHQLEAYRCGFTDAEVEAVVRRSNDEAHR